ncbi:clavata3/esr (cle)-related protein 16 [Phtheirospermum japonicum]|uniref:Clavata3/esr (Cle)-related protein 16 n=1 Tax=Phtheirospermum japonicum TaxID=374723 RepID=A0A830BND9_9LAMI|nr:clavata3/esr (cle)-related protein 16 [Phtheirospermum japonicum]
MTIYNEGEKRRRIERRKRWDYSTSIRIAVFSLLIASEVCSLSSAEKIGVSSGSRRSTPRKVRIMDTTSYHARPSVINSNKSSFPTDKIYEDEKRLVHTGPNPLHN